MTKYNKSQKYVEVVHIILFINIINYEVIFKIYFQNCNVFYKSAGAESNVSTNLLPLQVTVAIYEKWNLQLVSTLVGIATMESSHNRRLNN